MKRQQNDPIDEQQGRTRFYLIFDEMAKLGIEENVLAQELEEIERVSRMVNDVSEDEQPRFMTST